MTTRRHTQTLFPHPEQPSNANDIEEDEEDEDVSWDPMTPRTYPSPPPQPTLSITSSRSGRSSKIRASSVNPPSQLIPPPTAPTQYSELYSQFVRRYRSTGLGETIDSDDLRNDPDSHYFQRGLGQLNDAGDNSDDEESYLPVTAVIPEDRIEKVADFMLETDPIQPASQQERERLEWQALLASVLSGDVLKSEKTRIAVALNSQGDEQTNSQLTLFLAIRAKFHRRSIEEEKKKLEERRLRTVDGVINEVLNFRVSDPPPGQDRLSTALSEVTALLHRLDVVHSLYPSLKAFYLDKPAASQSAFQARNDTLNTWFTILTTLKHHFALLRRWTGSDTLDVNQPFTSNEVPISGGGPSRVNAHNMEIADGTSFVERLLKEESMQLTFEKGFLVTVHAFLGSARDAQVNLSSLFKEMNLPTFENELVPLISFPTKLAQACLRLRLDYVQKLKDPDILIIDQMTEDLKLSIGLACTLKRQYEAILAPDPDGNWSLPQCISEDYDSTILEALITFFKLLHWQLKSGAKGILFKETDILEAQWATFNDVSITTPGGSCLVAEQLCSLTNKLMVRVTNYFDTQVRVPSSGDAPVRRNTSPDQDAQMNATPKARHIHDLPQRKMTDQQVIGWYSKILESVRLRYRKLQRFARVLTQRFSNSAEYSLEGVPLDEFISYLVASDHFLVYTHSLEEEGVYIIASSSLSDRPGTVRRILDEAFQVDELGSEDEGSHIMHHIDPRGQNNEEAGYLLVLSPQTHFLWNGGVMVLSMPKVHLDTKENRVRLIADGPQRRLNYAKQIFLESFEAIDEDSANHSINLTCLVESQAHLPSVNRELRKIARATNRLAESIVDSVHQVRRSLRVTTGGSELLANWYLYASEHGQHAHRYMDESSLPKFNRLLIKLAISWVSFICDDCDPTDRKTFKWAVNALEYTLHRTKRDILHLPNEEFEMLRQKVASCMTLLMGHFDILGARSISEARKEKEKIAQLAKIQQNADVQMVEDDFPEISHASEDVIFIDPQARVFWDKVHRALVEVEESRSSIGVTQRIMGKVLNEEIPEDRSLTFLASSSSNISVRWQQGKFIGAGAFGSVYLALNLDNGSLMAVKEIKFQELSGLPNLFTQIKEELSVMEMLHHPNVVEYYGIEVHRDKVYIFEEYCQGGSLAALLEHGRIEDEGIIQVYTMQMLEGLVYLHSRGIVHRDIKPDNILLDHMGVIKFVDFGAAKILAKNQRTVQRSRRPLETNGMDGNANGKAAISNGLTGTPMYMSPEIIKNDRRGRYGAMDIWSLGCVVLEFATGKKPWSNLDNEWAIMFHIGVATQHPPLPEPGQLSELGINFIKQCLTIDPIRRPTAVELMDHPWMIDFKETLLQYETEELANEQSVLPNDHRYDQASVARQAAIAQGQEVEMMKSSPPDTPLESD